MIKIQTKQFVDSEDWDRLVEKTYGRIYNFQQQDGCKVKGIFYLTIPEEIEDPYLETPIPKNMDECLMGVRFDEWLKRDPKEWKGSARWNLDLFWERCFYPDIQMVANDLHSKGLIPAGDYAINIDW